MSKHVYGKATTVETLNTRRFSIDFYSIKTSCVYLDSANCDLQTGFSFTKQPKLNGIGLVKPAQHVTKQNKDNLFLANENQP